MSAAVAWARPHERLAAAGCFAVILAAWFPGLLIGREMGQSDVLWSQWPWLAERPGGLPAARDGQADAALVFHPLLVEAKRQLADGHLPLWNPGIFAGHPLLGDWQSGWLFPLNWPALLFGVAPLWGWIAMAKLLIAALGAFAFARALGVGRRAALASGVVYMLSAPLLVWLQWPLATGFALFPWLLLATECAVRAPGRRAVAGVAAAVGLSLLGGHPETVLLASSAAFVYLLVRGPVARGRARLAGGARPRPADQRRGVRAVPAGVRVVGHAGRPRRAGRGAPAAVERADLRAAEPLRRRPAGLRGAAALLPDRRGLRRRRSAAAGRGGDRAPIAGSGPPSRWP